MYNILVSGASGIVGYGILKSLGGMKELTLHGSTIYDDSPAVIFSHKVVKPPLTLSEGYFDWLLDYIESEHIDLIIPGIEDDLYQWNEHREVLESVTKVVLNNPKLIRLCRSKWEFYRALHSAFSQIAIPTMLCTNFHGIASSFGVPFLLKPVYGYGSRGITIVRSENDFPEQTDGLIAQPIIGKAEEEYTVSAFFDGAGTLRAYCALQRTLSKQGFTETASSIFLPGMAGILQQLGEIFNPVGPTNFQFRKDGNTYKLLEINPRISSATSIRSSFGYNESQMCIDYYLKNCLPVQPLICGGRAIRYTEDYVIYDRNHI